MSETKYTMLAKYVFPSEIAYYFEIEEITELSDELHFYMKEKDIVAEEYSSICLHSNGFYDSSAVTDFSFARQKSHPACPSSLGRQRREKLFPTLPILIIRILTKV